MLTKSFIAGTIMTWLANIYSAVYDSGEWLKRLALEAADIWVVGGILEAIISNIAALVISLRPAITQWYSWATGVEVSIQNTLSTVDLTALLKDWVDSLDSLWRGIASLSSIVAGQISEWWQATLIDVKGLITAAIQDVSVTLNATRGELTTLTGKWNNFAGATLPSLITGFDAVALARSELERWFPFYDDIAVVITELRDFAHDPLEWIYKQMDAFFERYW